MRINNSNSSSSSSSSSSSGSSNNPTSWMGWKEKASREYQDGNYEQALDSYRTSITSFTSTKNNCPPPPDERQIILSNMVACRLKIGGPVQAEAAVTTAKQCININPQWAKGHIRLASSYIALGGHSNDACNALQRALQLDPTNPTARDMLVKELRRDKNNTNATTATPATAPPENQDDRNYSFSSNNNTTNTSATSATSASAPPEDQDDRNYSASTNRSSSSPYSSSRRPTEESPSYGRYEDQPPSTQPTERPNNNNNNNNTYNDGIDETITWQDKLLFYYQRAKLWYMGQSDDVKSLFKVLLVLLLLYIAFGGRFGFEGSSSVPKRRGNYGKGNVYDQYYGRGDSSSASYPYGNNNDGDASSGSDYGRTSSSSKNTYNHRDNNYHHHQQQQQQRSHYDDVDDYYYRSTSSNHRRRGGSSSSSFHFPNLFDGSPQSMLILAGIAYMCYRNGINPMQVIFFLNMMNRGGGRRHHRHRGGMGMGGYGGGMGGYGGFGRRGFGRRRW